LAGWPTPAQLAASAFNQLSQYANRACCYAELALFFLAVAITSTDFTYPAEWPGWVGLGGLVKIEDGIPTNGHPSQY